MIRLVKLGATGLKSRDFKIQLGPLVAIVGPNGSGKTEHLQALQLLATGGLGEGFMASDRIMRMARGPKLEVFGVLHRSGGEGGGHEIQISREWSRDRQGKITKKVRCSTLPAGASVVQAEAQIASMLFCVPEVWSPSSLLALSPAKLRGKFSSMLGAELPADIKLGYPDLPPDERLRRAIGDAEAARNAFRAERLALEAETANAVYTPPANLAAIRQRYEDLQREGKRAYAWSLAQAEVEELGPPPEAPEEPYTLEDQQIAAEGLAEAKASAAAADANVSSAAGRVAALAELGGLRCTECGEDVDIQAVIQAAKEGLEYAAEQARDAHEYLQVQSDAMLRVKEAQRCSAAAQAGREQHRLASTRAKLRMEGPAPRPQAEIMADYEAAHAELEAAGAANGERQRLEGLKGRIADLERQIAGSAIRIDRLQALEAEGLRSGATELEAKLTAVLGRSVKVETVPECRILVDGVPLAEGVVSDGEWLAAAAALVRVLGNETKAPWRPVIVDRLEAISADRRRGFLRALAKACVDGEIDQVVVAGCPDEGVDGYNLDGADMSYDVIRLAVSR